MKVIKDTILTINGGSSSIKFTIYELEKVLTQILSGSIEISIHKTQHSILQIQKRKKV